MLMLADHRQSEESYRLLIFLGGNLPKGGDLWLQTFDCMYDFGSGEEKLLTHIMRQGDSHCYHLLFAVNHFLYF